MIVVISLLVLLVLLAMLLVHAGGMERLATRMRIDQARAGLLARSGVEYGLARLGRGTSTPSVRTRATQRDDWTCRDDLSIPIERLHNPSYAHGEPYVDVTADGRYAPPPGSGDGFTPALHDQDATGGHTGYTGRLRGQYGSYAETYVLRVTDESAKINVNGGFLDGEDRDSDGTPDHRDIAVGPEPATAAATGRGWNAQLRRILDVLGTVREDGDGDGTVDPGEDWDADGVLDPAPLGIADLGRRAIQSRPVGGYRSAQHVQETLGLARDLSPYLTAGSWTDTKVVRPNAHPAEIVAREAPAEIKRNRAALAIEEGGRPPINLNSASPAVLAALIEGIAGVSWFEGYGISPQTHVPEGWPLRYEIPRGIAAQIAGEMASRRPFATWQAFSSFCDSLLPGVDASVPDILVGFNGPDFDHQMYAGGNLCAADLLKANFDPNTQVNKQHADRLMWRWIDKTDLLAWSTEGSLDGTGSFGIESLGRVRDARGGEAALARVRTQTSLFTPWRQTTQEDFVAGRANLRDYLTLSTGTERTTGAGASWLGGGTGLATMTYPNPPMSLPSSASGMDGSIGLASVETAHSAPAGGTMTFLHHFDDGWDADVSISGALAREPGPMDGSLQTDGTVGVWPAPTQEPGTLYPDGMHVQLRREPAFSAIDHLPERGRHGVVSYWVKRPINRRWSFGLSCVRWVGPIPDDTTQGIFMGGGAGGGRDGGGGLVELADIRGGVDTGYEAGVGEGVGTSKTRPCMRWRLLTFFWDTDVPVLADSVNAWYTGFNWNTGSNGRASGHNFIYPGNNLDPGLEEDLVGAGETSRVFVMGSQLYNFEVQDSCDHIHDEFAIADFGDDPVAVSAAQGWHEGRFADGRYYKANDGTFTSDVLEPLPGQVGRILSASWTGYRPADGRIEMKPYGGQYLDPNGVLRGQDATLSGSRIEVELLGEYGSPLSPPRMLPERGAVGLNLDRFRYRVRFLPTPTWAPADRDNQPVLESPWFDDITFLIAPPGPPRIQGWEER